MISEILLSPILFVLIFMLYKFKIFFVAIEKMSGMMNFVNNLADECTEISNRMTTSPTSTQNQNQVQNPITPTTSIAPIEQIDTVAIATKRERLIKVNMSGEFAIVLKKISNHDYVVKSYEKYERDFAKKMSEGFGETIINFYLDMACSLLSMNDPHSLSQEVKKDPFTNLALKKFTNELYWKYGAMLAPITIGGITANHYINNKTTPTTIAPTVAPTGPNEEK